MAAKLTMKLARELAMRQFGTAKGLKKSDSFPGRYEMRFGQLGIEMVIVGKRVDKYKKRIKEVRTTVAVNYDS